MGLLRHLIYIRPVSVRHKFMPNQKGSDIKFKFYV